MQEDLNLEITTSDLTKYSIFVGTPMFSGQCAGYYTKSTNDLSSLCAKHGIELQFYYLFNESLIQRARNYVVDEFLRSSCTHLMFIDADIGFNPKDVLSLLGIQTKYPDKFEVMTGPYPKKSIAWEKVKKAVDKGLADENPFNLKHFTADYVFNAAPGVTTFKVNQPVEVAEGGTGFMLIPREVFSRYKEAYPELSYKPDHIRTENFDGSHEIHAYFDCIIEPESRRYLSEDYFFCWNARKAGIKVHMCPWMELKHVGSYIFSGSMAALSHLETSPTASEESNEKHYKKRKKMAFRP
jgi:hypothetical protein